jgi:vancomycin resistance protein YoaR
MMGVIEATRSSGRSGLRVLGWTLCGVLFVALVVVSVAGARAYAYQGEALPWVRVAGVDVGGRSQAQIEDALRHAFAPRLAQKIQLHAAGRTVEVAPGALLRLDAAATAQRALAARKGSMFTRGLALVSPVPMRDELRPVLHGRPRGTKALIAKLQSFATPPRSAQLVVAGTDVSVKGSARGTRVDGPALLLALRHAVESGGSTLTVPYVTANPRVADAAAETVAQQVTADLSAPVTLTYGSQQVGTLSPQRLARLLVFTPARGTYAVGLDETRLGKLLAAPLQPWRKRATNARFAVHGTRVSLVPSQDGVDVDTTASAQEILAAAAAPIGERSAQLAVTSRPPDLTTAKAQALGIHQQIATFTTDMGASSSNRIHNVHLMADFIDGTIIKPGEIFSFNKVVGPRTADRGFLEGQEIIGSLVLPSIGGGVCQTATTLFNDAFETGLPILARTNHNLYLSHYPLGRDATVSWGGPDLVFKNDLKHAILITTSYTDQTLTFTFYGTPQGRRVVSTTGPKVNWTAPTMSYAVDPSAPAGSVKVVGGGNSSGFDVTVSRTVYQHGKVLRKDSFTSHYVPDGPTTVYGPGRTPPGPYIVLPPDSGV